MVDIKMICDLNLNIIELYEAIKNRILVKIYLEIHRFAEVSTS